MRRRLDLAASLIGDPEAIFLDEPTTGLDPRVEPTMGLDPRVEPTMGLDPRARNQVWEAVRGLVAHGVTVLLTTQHLEEADKLADGIAVIDRARWWRPARPAI